MKLEEKFFNTFFYPFCFGILASIIIVITLLSYYSNDYLDETTAEGVYQAETTYSRNSIYSANLLLSDLLIKVKLVIDEQLSYFKIAANSLNLFEPREIKDVYNVIQTPENNNNLKERYEYASIWFVDPNTMNPEDNANIYNQLFLVSLTAQTMYVAFNTLKGLVSKFYYIFEDTNAFVAYPFKSYWENNKTNSFLNYENPSWCTDNFGNIVNYYKFKCRTYYIDIKKTSTTIFDNNSLDQNNRKIFITSKYTSFSTGEPGEFTMCIKFNYTLSNSTAFLCADIEGRNLFSRLDKINDKLLGYFTISSIGFNHQFYFPNIISLGAGKTLTEYIFNKDIDYYLEEKIEFLNKIQKQMTSNYIVNINQERGTNIDREPLNYLNEKYIDNNKKEVDQFFYVNKELYHYKIFPILLRNDEEINEHVFSIIYIYKESVFYEFLLEYETQNSTQLALQVILFGFFGGVLLYIIVLSFKILAKFIVVPIKNVQYMLEGINVGGEYRLEYLLDLKRKQEDNLEKLNKINRELSKKNKEKSDNFNLGLKEENKNNNINLNKKQSYIKDYSKIRDSEMTNFSNTKDIF